MKRFPAFLVLMVISLLSAVLLAATNTAAQGPMERAASVAGDAARFAVLPLAESFEQSSSPEGVDSLYTGFADGQAVGRAVTVTVQGYAGPVEVIVGMDTQNAITGLTVGGSGFAETAGLGSKAREPEFTDQFVGKTPPVLLGETIDAISGATITCRAVVEGVNLAAPAGEANPAGQAEPAGQAGE